MPNYHSSSADRLKTIKIRAANKDHTITDQELAIFSPQEDTEIFLSNLFGVEYKLKPPSNPSPNFSENLLNQNSIKNNHDGRLKNNYRCR